MYNYILCVYSFLQDYISLVCLSHRNHVTNKLYIIIFSKIISHSVQRRNWSQHGYSSTLVQGSLAERVGAELDLLDFLWG